MMQGRSGGSMMLTLKSGGFPVEVNNHKLKQRTDSTKTGVFSVERFITYSVVGKQRLFLLKITKKCKAERVNIVNISITEKSGKSSSANLNLQILRNDKYGVVCLMGNELSGSYELRKMNYSVPPLDTEIARYVCRESGDRSCFSLEKKKANDNINVVERVKCTHSLVVDDETLNVKVKITNDSRVGLRVDVDGPVKVATDYSDYVLEKIQKKMNGETEDSEMLHFGNTTDQPQYHVTDDRVDVKRMQLFRADLGTQYLVNKDSIQVYQDNKRGETFYYPDKKEVVILSKSMCE